MFAFRRRFFRDKERPEFAKPLYWVLPAVAVAVGVAGLATTVFPLFLVGAGGVWAIYEIAKLRLAVVLTPNCIEEWYAWRQPVRIWWGQVADLETEPNRMVVKSRYDDATIVLDERLEFWETAVEQVRAALDQKPPANPLFGHMLSPETIDGWLGLAPGQKLTLRSFGVGCLGGLAIAFFLLNFFMLALDLGLVWPLLLFVSAIALPILWNRTHLEVDGFGIRGRTGGRQVDIPWSDVRGIGPAGRGSWLQLHTADDSYWLLPSDGVSRLDSAIEQVLQARSQGLHPPTKEATAASLSLARLDGDPTSARGLSIHQDT